MLSNPFLRTRTCLSNITESRQRRKTFAEQRRGLIQKSLLVTLCLFPKLQRDHMPPVAHPNCPPSLDSSLGREKHQRGGNRKKMAGQERGQFWSGSDCRDERKKRTVAGWRGDEEAERGIVTGGVRLRNWEGLSRVTLTRGVTFHPKWYSL